MKLVFLDVDTVGDVENLKILNQFGDIEFYPYTSRDNILERAINKDIIITNKVLLDRKVLDNLPDLKLICIAATGMNNIDLDHAKKRNIQVKNVTDYSTNSVAQTTLAVILCLINKINYFDQFVKTGLYAKNEIFTHIHNNFQELTGKRFGIIGLGNIGRKVAFIAKGFGAEIVYYSTTGKNNNQDYQRVGLKELLSTSDIVSIHAPLNKNTEGLITLEKIKWMKPNSLLINMGRGGITDEADLAYALKNDIIGGAATDVFVHEPINKDNPLLDNDLKDKIILTPHIAWSSNEARKSLIDKIALNIKDFINNYQSK